MNEMTEKKQIKRNLLLPTDFLNRWISKDDSGNETFKYVDFTSDQVVEVEVENEPFIKTLFEWDDSFDTELIQRQYQQVAKIARAIFDRRIGKKNLDVSMTGKEVLFIKYFYFLVSLLNGDYRYNFNGAGSFRVFDVLNQEVDLEVRKTILSIISYVLFEMYDYIFTPRIFESLFSYIEESGVNFVHQEFKKQIFVPHDALEQQNYKFLDAYFHNIVNNTFIKIYKVSDLDKDSLILTNKTIANFMDEQTKISILSMFVVDPRFAIGLINLGPGRGEYRPLFKYITNKQIDQGIIPACIKPEHTIEEDGIYLSEEQRFHFKCFELTSRQLRLINECLTIRDLKTDLEFFIQG